MRGLEHPPPSTGPALSQEAILVGRVSTLIRLIHHQKPQASNRTRFADIACAAAVENLNQWYAAGDQAYILVASAMVLVMIPGLGFLYSGLARRKSALTMIWVTMASFSVITFQWYFWGYSLAFSAQGKSGFIGDLKHFGLMNTLGAPSPGSPLIPELLYSFYQVLISSDSLF